MQRYKVLASFAAVGSELDPRFLEAPARYEGLAVALPWFAGRDSAMEFRIADGALEPGPYRVLQPLPSAARCSPDLVLVPLLAFDDAGQRLGQGGGHYDRALASLPDAKRIGVGWSRQRVPALPTEAWDIALDAVVTEQGYWTP